jgi:hypothetical protein
MDILYSGGWYHICNHRRLGLKPSISQVLASSTSIAYMPDSRSQIGIPSKGLAARLKQEVLVQQAIFGIYHVSDS